jgi:peptidoglycan/LPS O-acetylase OafA/YrhL
VQRIPEAAGNAAIATSPRRRIAGIEGLRAIAALAIVMFHVWASGPRLERDAPVDLGSGANDAMAWLQSGVTLFFVLSGFLLFAPFASAVAAGSRRPSVRRYFVNRALRILPLYWVVLAFTALVADRELLGRPAELLANVFLVQTYVPGWAGSDYQVHGISPAWSLCVEAAFYVLLPVLGLAAVVAARRVRPRLALSLPILAMTAAGIASLAVGAAIHSPVFNHSLPIHAAWFAIGMTIAAISAGLPRERRPLRGTASRVAGAVVAVTLAGLSLKLWTSGALTFEAAQTVTAVSCGLLLALVVFAPPRSRLLRLLEGRWAVAAGAASYGIFLWHEPILRLLRENGLTADGVSGLALNAFVLTILTVAISLASYRLVERPCLELKQRRRRHEALGEPDARPAPAYAASPSN